ncbi:hypothetical protein N7537_004194 [Penicillium hordei]|uniref:Uncharacterized protein n=1 Tax=Penicillium hordei TaxID=40994 RepID=A0AAD6H5X0_9EURO|nr:uncharacterized protein N7537_004194 [Penicillium hordei]KAJ5607575.1 hypothetical protein N7537_004194 [Penicillium hordei]
MNSQWNEVSMWLQNSIEFVVNRTQTQVESDLKCVNDDILLRQPPVQESEETDSPVPSCAASTGRKRRRSDI